MLGTFIAFHTSIQHSSSCHAWLRTSGITVSHASPVLCFKWTVSAVFTLDTICFT